MSVRTRASSPGGGGLGDYTYLITTDGTTIYVYDYLGILRHSGLVASTEIQWAITQCVSGGKVVIKAGTYLLTAGLLIRSTVDLELVGEGWETKLVSVGDITPIQIGDRANAFPSVRIYVGHLYINGTSQTTLAATDVTYPRSEGIDISGVGCYDIIIEDCYIYNTGADSIYGYEATGYVLVADNIVVDARGAYAAIHTHGTYARWVIINNKVYNSLKGGIRHGLVIAENYIYSSGTALMPAIVGGDARCRVIGNIIEITRAAGIGIDPWGSNVLIANNHIEVANGIGINFSLNPSHVVVTGNYLYDCRADGIYIGTSTDVQVINNHLDRINQHGIHLNGADRCIVSGNVIHDAGQQTDATYHGIYLEGAAIENIISNNQIYANAANRTLHGIYITGASNGCVVSENHVENLDGDGVRVNDSNDAVINGNRITVNAGYGVNETGTSDYTLLDGNNVRGNTTGAHTVDAVNSVIGENIV